MFPRIAILLFVLMCACQPTDEDSNQLPGQWKWKESQDGFNGWISTPNTAGYDRFLDITDVSFKMYQDDSLIVSSPYSLNTLPYTLFSTGDSTVIELDNGMTWGILFDRKKLILAEICADCSVHTYRRR